MTKHDQRRIDALVKALNQANYKAEVTSLYLSIQEPGEALWNVKLAKEHIQLALKALGAGEGGENGGEDDNGESS